MSQSLAKLWVHIIFSTKQRYPFLSDPVIQQRMHAYLKAICCKQNAETTIVGGVEDHVHLLTHLPKTISLSDFIEEIKTPSSKWIKTIDASNETLQNFYWQNGYGAFSVSQSAVETVCMYIKNQYIHHQKQNFQDELRALLTKNNINYNEKYLFN